MKENERERKRWNETEAEGKKDTERKKERKKGWREVEGEKATNRERKRDDITKQSDVKEGYGVTLESKERERGRDGRDLVIVETRHDRNGGKETLPPCLINLFLPRPFSALAWTSLFPPSILTPCAQEQARESKRQQKHLG